MRTFGQFCPISLAAEIFCERWNPVIIRELLSGSRRFSEIHKGAPLMSPSLLTRRLKELEVSGVLERRKSASGKSYEYFLTEAGREFEPIVTALGVWGRRWISRTLDEEQLDIGLLMWDMRRTVNPDALPKHPAVVHFHFSDAPRQGPDWWMICEEGNVEVCLTDPGFDVDLFVLTDSATMTGLWRGDTSLSASIDKGALELQGPAAFRRKFNEFLGTRPWIGIRSQLAA